MTVEIKLIGGPSDGQTIALPEKDTLPANYVVHSPWDPWETDRRDGDTPAEYVGGRRWYYRRQGLTYNYYCETYDPAWDLINHAKRLGLDVEARGGIIIEEIHEWFRRARYPYTPSSKD